jgi:hypothetical protein
MDDVEAMAHVTQFIKTRYRRRLRRLRREEETLYI